MSRNGWLLAMMALIVAIAWLVHYWSQPHESPLPYPRSPNIRVLIKEDLDRVQINSCGEKLYVQIKGNDQPIEIQKQSELSFFIKNGVFNFSGFQSKVSSLKITVANQHFEVDGKPYDGKLSLYSTSKDKFQMVLHTQLEPYVARVIDGEMNSSWPLAALEAQAIAARSFAVYHLSRSGDREYDLRGDARAQAYAINEADTRCRNAAIRTQNLILLQNQKPLLAYYVSTCGGSTRQHRQSGMHYNAVSCDYCQDSPYYTWQETVPRKILRGLLGERLLANATLDGVQIECDPNSPHVLNITFIPSLGPSLKIKSLDFRRYLNAAMGREVIRNLLFTLTLEEGLKIEGHGWGYHGIGLCQYGTKKLAELGRSYIDILNFYYQETVVAPIPMSLEFNSDINF